MSSGAIKLDSSLDHLHNADRVAVHFEAPRLRWWCFPAGYRPGFAGVRCSTGWSLPAAASSSGGQAAAFFHHQLGRGRNARQRGAEFVRHIRQEIVAQPATASSSVTSRKTSTRPASAAPTGQPSIRTAGLIKAAVRPWRQGCSPAGMKSLDALLNTSCSPVVSPGAGTKTWEKGGGAPFRTVAQDLLRIRVEVGNALLIIQPTTLHAPRRAAAACFISSVRARVWRTWRRAWSKWRASWSISGRPLLPG